MTTIDPDLEAMLKENGYLFLRLMPDGTIAGVTQFAFTFGLCNRLDWESYDERWCFEEIGDAILALAMWDGEGDPPGPWIKRKGRVEKHNPKLFDLVAVNGDGSGYWKPKAVIDREALWGTA